MQGVGVESGDGMHMSSAALTWGVALEGIALYSYLCILWGRRVERQLRDFDPDTLPRGTRVFYGRAKGWVLISRFLMRARVVPILVIAGVTVLIAGFFI
jgi:hypothetical protein